MTAPIVFTNDEQDALGRVDKLSRSITQIDREIQTISRRIVREKARRDNLIARKLSTENNIRDMLELIDTAKTRLEIP